jgi:hypothetical protein
MNYNTFLFRKGSQIGADRLGIWVLGAEGRFKDGKGLLEIGTGSGVIAQVPEQKAQVVQTAGGIGVLLAKDFTVDGENSWRVFMED